MRGDNAYAKRLGIFLNVDSKEKFEVREGSGSHFSAIEEIGLSMTSCRRVNRFQPS
jgi:hypothetical protein